LARYYLGVDWADQSHQLYVSDESGRKIRELEVQQTADGLAELGRWLEESRGQGIELWAAIEKPEGRVVDFLWITVWWSIRSTPRPWIGLGIGFA